MDSKWGPSGSKMGKDPKKKKLPRTWGKRKTSFQVRPYMKIMARRGA